MERFNGEKPDEGHPAIVIVSRDEDFINRLRSFALKPSEAPCAVTVFNEPLGALVHLLMQSPNLVVYDMDSDAWERDLETLRAIRLICRGVPIILGASEHSASPFGHENDVGIFYRLVKSAPDSEMETAVESAKRCLRR